MTKFGDYCLNITHQRKKGKCPRCLAEKDCREMCRNVLHQKRPFGEGDYSTEECPTCIANAVAFPQDDSFCDNETHSVNPYMVGGKYRIKDCPTCQAEKLKRCVLIPLAEEERHKHGTNDALYTVENCPTCRTERKSIEGLDRLGRHKHGPYDPIVEVKNCPICQSARSLAIRSLERMADRDQCVIDHISATVEKGCKGTFLYDCWIVTTTMVVDGQTDVHTSLFRRES